MGDPWGGYIITTKRDGSVEHKPDGPACYECGKVYQASFEADGEWNIVVHKCQQYHNFDAEFESATTLQSDPIGASRGWNPREVGVCNSTGMRD